MNWLGEGSTELGGEPPKTSEEVNMEELSKEEECGMCDENDKPWHDDYVFEDIRGCFTLDEYPTPKKASREGGALQPVIQKKNAWQRFEGDWEVIKVCPDSGACKFVAPMEMVKEVPWKETEASKNGLRYRAADGSPIYNQGEKRIEGYDSKGNKIGCTWQGAKITKPLAGIREMCKAGNRVTFDIIDGKDVSQIYNKKTGVSIPIENKNNAYEFEMWVKKQKAIGPNSSSIMVPDSPSGRTPPNPSSSSL